MKMRKLLLAVAAVMMTAAVNAQAFTFPVPDWGALLNERKNMVTEDEFELYTEGSVDSAPYYGARLEPRGGTYIGMVAETSQEFQPLGSYLTYIQEMSQNDLYYPANSMIESDNVISMVGWTITDINNIDYNQVRRVLDRLNTYNKPMCIRFANEMNVSAIGSDPDKYVEVFRTVANMVHEYPNFAVVWSPNDIGALNRPFEYFYPGDEYVDWVGVSSYSIRYFQGNKNTSYNDSVYFMTGDYAWATNRLKPIMEFLSKNNINKPVMVSEGGVATHNNLGDDCEEWAKPRLRNMLWYINMKYPQVKMINYFNVRRDHEKEKFDISDYPYAANIYKEASSNGAYIRRAGGKPDFVFRPANSGETLTAKDDIVKLYTLAYLTGKPNITVNYSIDGSWYHSSNEIPYICRMSLSGISDGEHTLTIRAENKEKSYVFYKSGQSIRFGAEPEGSAAKPEGGSDTAIKVTYNGRELAFDQPPVIRDDRTLVPMRAIFEALGADVDWNEKTRTATGTKDGKRISITIGENRININGENTELDVAAQLINERTMIPVRAISEAFDCRVDWDSSSKTVIITEKNI